MFLSRRASAASAAATVGEAKLAAECLRGEIRWPRQAGWRSSRRRRRCSGVGRCGTGEERAERDGPRGRGGSRLPTAARAPSTATPPPGEVGKGPVTGTHLAASSTDDGDQAQALAAANGIPSLRWSRPSRLTAPVLTPEPFGERRGHGREVRLSFGCSVTMEQRPARSPGRGPGPARGPYAAAPSSRRPRRTSPSARARRRPALAAPEWRPTARGLPHRRPNDPPTRCEWNGDAAQDEWGGPRDEAVGVVAHPTRVTPRPAPSRCSPGAARIRPVAVFSRETVISAGLSDVVPAADTTFPSIKSLGCRSPLAPNPGRSGEPRDPWSPRRIADRARWRGRCGLIRQHPAGTPLPLCGATCPASLGPGSGQQINVTLLRA